MATECPAADGSSPRQTKFDGPLPMCIDPDKSYTAEIVTNHGTLTAFLYPQKAPKTVNNFVSLARYHYYDGLIFHRIIREFMIQGGCPEGSGRGGPGYRFEDELPEPGKYEVGSLAMANAGPNTNGSQFFIVSRCARRGAPAAVLAVRQADRRLRRAERSQNVPTASGDRPKDDVVIESVTIIES